MRVCFLSTSHAAQHLSRAAAEKGFELCAFDAWPDIVFVSEDTPTNENGTRNLSMISGYVGGGLSSAVPVVLTSQVPPGFTRAFKNPRLFHQAETLRIKDAALRASHPEMMIVGCADPDTALPDAYDTYLKAFDCPILTMSYESAEFAKMAINAFLISQVETTNMLSRLAAKCGAEWASVREALQHDSRIGPQAYLEPGNWQDSKHLLRDYVTLTEISFTGNSLLNAWIGFQYT